MPRTTRSTRTTAKLPKSEAVQYLAKVPEEYVFWSIDGRILRDMKDLKEALDIMTVETFRYHCNDVKKDFSNWVKDIVKDEKLAKELEQTADLEQARKAVDTRYDYLASLAI
jgi:hypothetical protein